MAKGAPPPPDYRGAAEEQAQSSAAAVGQQTQANRPDITTPWASQTWQQGPDGQWGMQTALNGGLGQAAGALQGQAANAMANPLDFGGLGQLGTGDSARQQAIDSAYGQATSRLDPQWQQREAQTRTRLLNQGLGQDSEAYKSAMEGLSRERNDAYGGAMSNAIGQGTAAGSAVFGQNLAARQQAMTEALRQRGQPLQELQSLQGFLTMPGFQGAGAADPTQYMAAANAQGQYALQDTQMKNDFWGGLAGGVMGLASAPFSFLGGGKK